MFCPRCGRQVNETANFCGGCGLSKAEIEKYTQYKSNTETVSNDTTKCDNTVECSQCSSQENPTSEFDSTVECSQCSSQENSTSEFNQYSATETNVSDNSQETSSQQNEYTQPNTAYANTQPKNTENNQNLSTVDFIWTIILSGIPIVGLIYLIYLAIQDNNINKRSYARAVLIVTVFAMLVAFLFFAGMLFSALF